VIIVNLCGIHLVTVSHKAAHIDQVMNTKVG